MRAGVLIFAIVAVAAVTGAAFVFSLKRGPTPVCPKIVEAYSRWRKTFGKLQASPAEMDYRLRIFEEQSKQVAEWNEDYNSKLIARGDTLPKSPMFILGETSDMSEEEFAALHPEDIIPEETEIIDESFAKNKYVVKKDLKTLQQDAFEIRVRRQGTCGSCWAHAAIAVGEKSYWTQTKQRVDLSQQELVDCDKINHGCDGGSGFDALNYIAKNGVALVSSYPYTGIDAACSKAGKTRVSIANSAMKMYWGLDPPKVHSLLASGLWTVSRLWSRGKWRQIGPGDDVFDASLSGECAEPKTSHIVAFVSSGTYSGGNYFRILNSAGTTWGDKGLKKVKPCSDKMLWGGTTNGGTYIGWIQPS